MIALVLGRQLPDKPAAERAERHGISPLRSGHGIDCGLQRGRGGGDFIGSASSGGLDRGAQRVRALLHLPGRIDRAIQPHQEGILRLEVFGSRG